MAVERTLSIIKPDAVGKNVIGQIISRFEEAGLTVVAAKCCTCRITSPVVSTPSTEIAPFTMTSSGS